jgi:LuxR family transcriptional regulator, maltose regulon positive regulatory protein
MAEPRTCGGAEPVPSAQNSTGEPLMMAKFRAGFGPPSIVVRQRLLDRLSEGVRRPLTLVSAPAGAGKTTLVGSWAAAGLSPGALTWITLDRGDVQPGVFWSYLLEGLSRSGVPVATVAAPLRPEEIDQSFLVQLSAHLYGLQEPVVVVLDDAEVLVGSLVLNQIDFLLRHAGPQLRVVLVTRVFPALAVHRHRLAGSLTEIGFDDLAFTEPEARVLLGVLGVVNLADDALSSLMSRTRGWAAGLALAAISMRHRPDLEPAVSVLAGDRGDLADYFTAEVLDAQPPGIRRFMLQTSIVTHLRPALADRLTGRRDAARTLRTLARANAFLEVCSQHDECYCYHPLFADLLRDQLGDAGSPTVVHLHRKAAEWFAATGSLTDAVGHATVAGDWRAAAAFLVDDLAIVRLLVDPQASGLAALLARMPEDARGPEPAVIHAALAIGRSDVESCTKYLSRAQELTEDAAAERTKALALAVSFVELVLARTRADLDGALSAAATVEALLDEFAADGVAAPRGARALVLLSTGGAMLADGRPQAAAATLAKGVRAARGAGSEYLRLSCLGLLALVEAVSGGLARAAELGRAAESLADQCGLSIQRRPPAAAAALAWVHAEWCEASAARSHAEQAEATDGIRTDPIAAAVVALVRARLLRTAGDLDGALATIGRARMPRSHGQLPGWLDHRLRAAAAATHVGAGRLDAAVLSIGIGAGSDTPEIALELARVELARGEVARAGITTTELLRQPDLSVGLRIDGWLLQASCALERGDTPQARTALDHALRLAEPERVRRPVVEAPPRLRSLIRQSGEITGRHPWLGGPLSGTVNTNRAVPAPLSTPDTSAASVIIEPLTEKEQEVLRHLAALLSTEEIARKMFVSVNTVRTHVRGILRKLAASRRNEAIRRAQELNLI